METAQNFTAYRTFSHEIIVSVVDNDGDDFDLINTFLSWELRVGSSSGALVLAKDSDSGISVVTSQVTISLSELEISALDGQYYHALIYIDTGEIISEGTIIFSDVPRPMWVVSPNGSVSEAQEIAWSLPQPHLTNGSLTPWYLVGGVDKSYCKRAYKPMGSLSLAESYSDLSGNQDAALGMAPTFYRETGWNFDGTMYLTTGFIPADTNITILVRIDATSAQSEGVLGAYINPARGCFIRGKELATHDYMNGGGASKSSNILSAVFGFAGDKTYLNGVDEGLTIAAGTQVNVELWMGGLHIGSSNLSPFKGNIVAVAIYNAVLTPAQVLAISTVMRNFPLGGKDGLVADDLRDDYIDLGFGVLVDWNMPSFVNAETAAGDLDPNTFNPSDLDIDQWIHGIVSSGAKYAVLTTKHHDGFCLWPTAFHETGENPYSIVQTNWYSSNGNPDVVALFVNACNAHGIKPCLYFSMWDLTHEIRSGTDETTDAAAYISMIKTQLAELLAYKPTAIWSDGWEWALGYEEITYAEIYAYIKGLDQSVLLIENGHTHPTGWSEIEVYEDTVDAPISAGNTRRSEWVESMRIDNRWFYNSTLDQSVAALTDAATLHAAILSNNGKTANFLLAVTPDTTGHLPSAQITRLGEIGAI